MRPDWAAVGPPPLAKRHGLTLVTRQTTSSLSGIHGDPRHSALATTTAPTSASTMARCRSTSSVGKASGDATTNRVAAAGRSRSSVACSASNACTCGKTIAPISRRVRRRRYDAPWRSHV